MAVIRSEVAKGYVTTGNCITRLDKAFDGLTLRVQLNQEQINRIVRPLKSYSWRKALKNRRRR